jgi:TonB family protein
MNTFFRIFLIVILLILTVGFTFDVSDIRLEELNYLLGKVDASQDVSNTLGIIGKYELIKKRMEGGEQNINNYQLEAKIAALMSGEQLSSDKNIWKKQVYRVPVKFVLNVIRLTLGKPIINPKEEDKIYHILEIGYFWERNRKYNEANKVYNQVLSMQALPPDIQAAVLVHKAFCHSMLSEYDISKAVYEKVINLYPNTEAGTLSWKLLAFIESMEGERTKLEGESLSDFDKAKQFYLLMNYRNSIKYYSIFLSGKQPEEMLIEARYYKGRAHEELGETEEAIAEYSRVIRDDKSRQWAKEANRRMLMLGEFYEQRKQIAEEAKKQLAAYQDMAFMNKVQEYAKIVSDNSSLRKELYGNKQTAEAKRNPADDSLLNFINKIGDLDLTGEKAAQLENAEIDRLNKELLAQGKVAEAGEIRRKLALSENPFRRPTFLKKVIDENSNQLQYIYNRKLRSGIKLSGRILVKMRIKPDGSISDATVVSSNMGDAGFEKDILSAVKTYQFKPVGDSLGDFTVTYPFDFSEESSQ